MASLPGYWEIIENYWTSVYDIGNETLSTFDSLGIVVDTRSLGSMGTSERLYIEEYFHDLKREWRNTPKEKMEIYMQAGELVLLTQPMIYLNQYKGKPICFKTAG